MARKSTGTFTRPTTQQQGESTFTRPSQQKEETGTFTRPTQPKQEGESTFERPSEQTSTQTRPNSRVDHPEGKRQYMDQDDEPAVPEVKDASSIKCSYKLTVKSVQRNAADVIKDVLGSKYADKPLPFTITYNDRTLANGLDNAQRLVRRGATVELKKIVTIEFQVF